MSKTKNNSKAIDNSEAKKKYHEDHLVYERNMLEFTFKAIHDKRPPMEWDVYFESFCIHARNLYDFLRSDGKSSNTYRACDFTDSYKKPAHKADFNKLDGQIFHMSHDRVKNEKVTLDIAQKLGEWLDVEWAKWAKTLHVEYINCVSETAVCIKFGLVVGLSPASATNHTTALSSKPHTPHNLLHEDKKSYTFNVDVKGCVKI